MVDDSIGQKPHRHTGLRQTNAVVNVLAVHKQCLIEIADLLNHGPRQQNAAERDKADLLFFGKFGAVLFVAAQVLYLAGLGVQLTARKPDLVGRVHKQHLRATDRPRGGLGQQLFKEIRADRRVVVQQQCKVAAVVQRTAHTDVVGRGKADVALLRQEHRVRRQLILQLCNGIIRRRIVD